jgi:phosphoribosylformylglycinamidine synthase
VHDGSQKSAAWRPALCYPNGANPDGSMDDIAGVTSVNGLAFGLMNHPERARDPHVRMAFFENGIHAV